MRLLCYWLAVNATHSLFFVLVIAMLGSACKGSAPTPEPAAEAPEAAEAPKPKKLSDTIPNLTAEQKAAIDRIPRPEPDAEGNIDLGAMTVHVPEAWTFVKPHALMRRAQFDAPGEGGMAEAVVFFVGKNGAGPIDANLNRWIRQFTNDDGTAVVDVVPKERKIAGFDVVDLEVAGNYSGGMTPAGVPGTAKPDQRLVAAIGCS